MTREQLEQQYLVVDEMTFTPRYEYKKIEVIEDGKIILVDDYTITATAQEVYQEWKEQQNQPSVPTAEECIVELEQQNSMLMECVLEMSAIIYA
jgi:hypothetical protein